VILAAIARQRTWEQWREPRFIPHPATWINGRRWTDEEDRAAFDPTRIHEAWQGQKLGKVRL
jgi:hypothetical protein